MPWLGPIDCAGGVFWDRGPPGPPHVILSAAKDLMQVASGDEVLRYAQDDRYERAWRPAVRQDKGFTHALHRKILFAEGGVGRQFGHRPAEANLAFFDDVGAVGHGLREVQVLLGQEHA